MHAKVHEGHNEEETTRGASLRELTQFFKDRDQNEGYAGLRRIADEDGTAVWTILKETEVAKKLEERTKERKQEERRRDDRIFNAQYAQVRAPSVTTDVTSKPADATPEEAVATRAQLVLCCPRPYDASKHLSHLNHCLSRRRTCRTRMRRLKRSRQPKWHARRHRRRARPVALR